MPSGLLYYPKGTRITLCGSTKFKEEFNKVNMWLTLQGFVVYSVAAFGHADAHGFTPEQKALLDEVHKLKIDNSDAIFVIDVDRYIGDSTKSEIEYAKSKRMMIDYYHQYKQLIK